MPKQVILILTLPILALAGCAAPAGPTAEATAMPASTAEVPPTLTANAPTVEGTEGSVSEAEVRVYALVPGQSEARFLIEEVLAGSPKTVVGATPDVSGEIRGGFDNPAGVEVGEVRVDMSTLRTDNSFRNRAIHDAILQTGVEANRFAVFRTSSIDGLPQQSELGVSYPLRLTGELTIHGVTRTVTFEAQVTAVSTDRLEGLASATLRYQDFGVFVLRLPPQVASVGDEVTLEIEFAAEAE